MKNKTSLLLFLLTFFFFFSAFTQSDKGFHYQAMARDNSGEALTNTSVNLRFQIRENTPAGALVYQEKHTPVTNNYGLLQVNIGKGVVESGDFNDFVWTDHDYYLIVELNGFSVDTSLFEAVPMAKVATNMNLDQLRDVNASNVAPDQVLTWDGTAWVPGDDKTEDADASPDNEIQSLSISGNMLSISNGNTIALPAGTTYNAGTGISISGSMISNSAPDQTVTLNGTGATSVSGTYPNFTINSTDNVNDADASATNEIQSLSLSSNTLSLSLGGGSVSLASLVSPWNTSGSNLYFNTGNVGIGDNSPTATLTVGNGDKLQVHGSDGDIVFNDDQGSLRFASSNGANAPMIQMFASGTNNSTRMLLAHSPSFPSWGIQYNDTSDAFTWMGDNIPVLYIQLAGQQRVGIGTSSPETKFHVSTNSATGYGHVKLTETQFDFSRITFNNNIHNNFWDIAARTDTNLANAQFNIYHSSAGDLFTVNARGRIGINDATPSYTLDIDGNQNTRVINITNDLPTTSNTTYNYGVRANLSQASNNGFPRLYNFYGISTDSDAYLSYGIYAYASGASNNNYGIYAFAPTTTGYAGYFSGNTYATGSYLTSDARLKSEIQPLKSGLEKVMQLKPKAYTYDRVKYDFMNLPEGEQFGFLAQEVEALLPNLTNKAFHAYDEAKSDTPEGQGFEFKVVNYIGMIPVMVSAMQEQQTIIQNQEDRISQLEKKIQELELLIKK
ncbi:MAG: tail fiber domain-containing protein [Bacteroidetes bacterium]|nr:tail fiber domain-containing protein [Bacteroidota bacterium]MCB0843711.1 tail fiber domain-containing protein [Bacteroidota bacterium]